MVEEEGRMTERQRRAICPTHPQSKQIADIPSYQTAWSRLPILTFEIRGESKSI